MTEMEWLRYLNPWEMLDSIARSEMPGLGRKLLLYAASVCRRSWAQIRSKGGRRLVRVIERFADGKAGERALTKALRFVSFDPEEHPITDLAPFDIATCMYHTGIDPFTKQEGYVAKGLWDREMQRALMQFFKPENYFMVREALIQAGRADLIGGGCDCLIPAQPPKETIETRRQTTGNHLGGERS
jgi:hypothetical protein